MYKKNLLGLSVMFFILFAVFVIFGSDSFSAGIFLTGLSITLVFYFKKPKNKNCRYVEGR